MAKSVTERSKGEPHGSAKLSEEDVIEIRRLRSAGVGLQEIADQFGVSFSLVGYIARGELWKHLP